MAREVSAREAAVMEEAAAEAWEAAEAEEDAPQLFRAREAAVIAKDAAVMREEEWVSSLYTLCSQHTS